jgi:hypothetical protein
MKQIKSKNIKIDKELVFQIETLCKLLHTNFSNKTTELLVDWQIEKLLDLKNKAPEIYEKYHELIKKNN